MIPKQSPCVVYCLSATGTQPMDPYPTSAFTSQKIAQTGVQVESQQLKQTRLESYIILTPHFIKGKITQRGKRNFQKSIDLVWSQVTRGLVRDGFPYMTYLNCITFGNAVWFVLAMSSQSHSQGCPSEVEKDIVGFLPPKAASYCFSLLLLQRYYFPVLWGHSIFQNF